MRDEFYSLEMLAMSYQPERYETPQGGMATLFRQARRDYEELCAVLCKLENEENQ